MDPELKIRTCASPISNEEMANMRKALPKAVEFYREKGKLTEEEMDSLRIMNFGVRDRSNVVKDQRAVSHQRGLLWTSPANLASFRPPPGNAGGATKSEKKVFDEKLEKQLKEIQAAADEAKRTARAKLLEDRRLEKAKEKEEKAAAKALEAKNRQLAKCLARKKAKAPKASEAKLSETLVKMKKRQARTVAVSKSRAKLDRVDLALLRIKERVR